MNNSLIKDLQAMHSNMCRLCLVENGDTETQGLELADTTLLQKIYECTSLQITPLAGAPPVCCAICKARLEDFYLFRRQCIRNDEIIQRIAGCSNKAWSSEASFYGAQPYPESTSSSESVGRDHAITGPYFSPSAAHECGPAMDHSLSARNEPEINIKSEGSFNSSHNTDTSVIFRRKRGRPPKKPYDSGLYSESSGSQHPPVDLWQGEPGKFSRGPHEPSNTSTDDDHTNEGWYKSNLEQEKEHQVHNGDQRFAEPKQPVPIVPRGRGRPPRQARCPNEDREEYRFRCRYCNARFNAAINLKLHTNTHTGEKPFLCTICHKAFAHPSNLSVHMKLHSNRPVGDGTSVVSTKEIGGTSNAVEKRFQCPYCQTFFAMAFQLKIHINTHTGHKPYVCKNCGKGFAQPSNMHVHSKKHCRQKDLSPNEPVPIGASFDGGSQAISTMNVKTEIFSQGETHIMDLQHLQCTST